MTLEQHLKKRIQKMGSLGLHDFMDDVLSHPHYGYYHQKDPFGTNGDFTTAPEISQLFGEMIGLWIVDLWQQMMQPKHFIIVEAGPGRGTLMDDVLRVVDKFIPQDVFVDVRLIEASARLHQMQYNCLKKRAKKSNRIEWSPSFHCLKKLPKVPLFFIANEFFDAIGINQFFHKQEQWFEKKVVINDNEFHFTTEPSSFKPHQDLNIIDNAPFEDQRARKNLLNDLLKIFQNHPAVAGLIIDYGYSQRQFGDSFQAVYKHQFCDPLKHIGQADLTSHVCFDDLKDTIEKNASLHSAQTTQGQFLRELGIGILAQLLIDRADEKGKIKIAQDVQRLSDPEQMGELFKVLSFYSSQLKPGGFQSFF